MKVIRKLTGLFLLSTIAGVLQAQNTDCIVRKSFFAREGTYLRISNKFGDINIITSKDDSISVCAIITIKQDDEELLQKSISLIKIDIDKSKDTVDIQTVFDEKFFSPSYRKGRSGFSVDYAISVPAGTNLAIKNAFGDVVLDQISGIVNAKLSQGDFRASKLTRGNLKPVSSLYFENGKVSIEEANWLTMTTRHCQSVKIGRVKALLMTSEFSKLTIGELSSLVCNSKSDSYEITAVKNLIAESYYTAFEIGQLSGQLRARTSYGTISVSELLKDFTIIDVTSSHTPFKIVTQKGASFKTDITVTNTLLYFPFEVNPMVKRSTEKNATTITGVAGSNRDTQSLIKIKADFGTLEIK